MKQGIQAAWGRAPTGIRNRALIVMLYRGGLRISEALALMERFRISGVPITDADGRLVGILTNRDLRFLEDYTLKIDEVMTKENLVTVPPGRFL